MNNADTLLQCVLVMPVYNEQDCIRRVISEWTTEFRSLFGDTFRIIAVNDGSSDTTGRELDAMAAETPELSVIHQANAGHGAAVVRGYREALELKPAYVAQVDSDDQFTASDFSKLWNMRERSRFILGWREERGDSIGRKLISKTMHGILFLILGARMKDANIPYRLIEARYLGSMLDLIPPGVFAPNIFLSVLAVRTGQSPGNVPVLHRDRTTGKVSIVRWRLLKACFRSVAELISFRVQLNSKVKELMSRS